MRRATVIVVGLVVAASLSWMPAAQAAKPQPCLIDVYDMAPWGAGVLEVPSGSWVYFRTGQIVLTQDIRDEFLASSVDSLALDGVSLTYEYEFIDDYYIEAGIDYGPEDNPYDVPVTWAEGEYPAVFIDYLFRPLKPGTHTLVHEWYLTEPWTDGWYPVWPVGRDWGGTMTIVVTPRTQYPSGQNENLCRTA